VVKIKKSRAHH